MLQKTLIGVLSITVLVLVALAGYLAFNRGGTPPQPSHTGVGDPPPRDAEPPEKVVARPGQTVTRQQSPNPPPPPKPVANPDRLKQNLQPGKTYTVHVAGKMNMSGQDLQWGIKGTYHIEYAYKAHIDREIVSNDGTTIVEVRHFRDVQSEKLDTTLDDLHLDLGPLGETLLPPQVRAITDNVSLKPVFQTLRMLNYPPEKLVGLQDKVGLFVRVNSLSGKSVRLKYQDGKGVEEFQVLDGEITAAERDFLLASVLASDSLLLPDCNVPVNTTWDVDGSNFAHLMDPGMLARVSGRVWLKRAENRPLKVLKAGGGFTFGEPCSVVAIVSGPDGNPPRLNLDGSTATTGKIGYFDPIGEMLFSPTHQVFVQANLKGKGKLDQFSKDHLLFQTRNLRQPEIEVSYSCEVRDTVKGVAP